MGGAGLALASCSFLRPGIQSLLDSLQKLSPRLEGRKDDLQFLQTLVESNEFHSLIQVSCTPFFLASWTAENIFHALSHTSLTPKWERS